MQTNSLFSRAALAIRNQREQWRPELRAQRLLNTETKAEIATELPTIDSLANVLALLPTAAEQCRFIKKIPRTLEELLVGGDPLQNMMCLLESLKTPESGDSLAALALLRKKVITNKRILFNSNQLSGMLTNNTYTPQLKLKLFYLIKNTEAFKKFLANAATEEALHTHISLLEKTQSILNIPPNNWANTIDLPSMLMKLESANDILTYMKKIHEHDPQGEFFTTNSFENALNQKKSLISHNDYESICKYCVKQIADQSLRLKFLADIGSLGAGIKTIGQLTTYVALGEVNWVSILPLLPLNQRTALLQMGNLSIYFAENQAREIMALPCTIKAMDKIPAFENDNLSAYLRLMPQDLIKDFVWRARNFNFDYLSRYIQDSQGNIDWTIACSPRTKSTAIALTTDKKFNEQLPERNYLEFFEALKSLDLRAHLGNFYAILFKRKTVHQLSFEALLAVMTSLSYKCFKSFTTLNLSDFISAINVQLQKINLPSVTAAVYCLARRKCTQNNFYTLLTDRANQNRSTILDPIIDVYPSLEKHISKLEKLLRKKKDDHRDSDKILAHAISQLRNIQTNRLDIQEIIDIILDIESCIERLNAYYAKQRHFFTKKDDMFGLAHSNEPKILQLRYASNYMIQEYVINIRSLDAQCLQLIAQLQARNSSATLSSSAENQMYAPSAPPAPVVARPVNPLPSDAMAQHRVVKEEIIANAQQHARTREQQVTEANNNNANATSSSSSNTPTLITARVVDTSHWPVAPTAPIAVPIANAVVVDEREIAELEIAHAAALRSVASSPLSIFEQPEENRPSKESPSPSAS